MEGDKDDGFGFNAGFVFEDSDNEKEAPAQPAWAFPDSKREMERELKTAGVTSVDIRSANEVVDRPGTLPLVVTSSTLSSSVASMARP